MRYEVKAIYSRSNDLIDVSYGTCSDFRPAAALFLEATSTVIGSGWQVIVVDNKTGEIVMEDKVRE